MSKETVKKPEVIVFAGPNGSGKSTVTLQARIIHPYINADNIKAATFCSDLEAAREAERLRYKAIQEHCGFSFETVFSTERNLVLLKKAKEEGYFIRCIYILTDHPQINVIRVSTRVENGGHGVEKEKIIQRYYKCMKLVPEIFWLSDVFYLYDNTSLPDRIAMKKRGNLYLYGNEFWDDARIYDLLGVSVEE